MAKVVTPLEITTSNPVGEPTIRKVGKRHDLADHLISRIRRLVGRSRGSRSKA